MRITEQQVEQAEQRAATAEGERDVAARRLELSPYSDLAAAEHTEALRTAAQLRANAREVRAAFERQVEEERRRASRPVLERAAAAAVKAAGAEMAERETALVEAVERAQSALVGLALAGGAYSAAVESHAEVLAAAGLDTHGEVGGERTLLGEHRLVVGGVMFEGVDAGHLAAWVLRRVVDARLPHHVLVNGLMGVAATVEQRVPRVVGAVSRPEQVKVPRQRMLSDVLRGSK
ncbi:hypothetical protein [Streptomyces sp. NPDC057838]|uniref:hypothetical protein n=1 Tax=unclassified Streptomyces TaxID=2593676 RepID=UPI00369E6430